MKISYFFLFFLGMMLFSCQDKIGPYVCKPCDLPCDKLSFSEPGICPHCGMELIKKSELLARENLTIGEINIEIGSGIFLISGGSGKENAAIEVFYHKPEAFHSNSKILIVIPGAGRDGDEYRDAWIEASEKYNVLILSPRYSEEDYPFEDYHLCGLVKDVNLESSATYVDNSNEVILNEDQLTFSLVSDSNRWIFNDFDRLFDLVTDAIGSEQTTYDIFGHSAGGQILHRLAIFHPNLKTDRILASNSGFYTMPDIVKSLPFGINNGNIKNDQLKKSFEKKLILFLGENDNENETGGTLLRSVSADLQGTHRLERGTYFYNYAEQVAQNSGYLFNWKLEIIPGVGHNQRMIAHAAAKYLYDTQG